ncbi:MAG: OmpA family protein [Cytophagales bacterium]
MNLKVKLLFSSFFLIASFSFAQKIVWADRIVKSTNKFEKDNNHAGHALGMPILYQGMMYGGVDLFTDGYIITNQDQVKKNSFRVGFSESIMAQQIIIGGVINLGTIQYIYAYNKLGKKTQIYQMYKGSVSKFHNFFTFFSPMEISSIEIVLDHQKVRDWNLIKGIGLTNVDTPFELIPNIYSDDEFFGKEKINFKFKIDGCVSFNQKLSPDGREVYFVKECFNRLDNQDIWHARMQSNGDWDTEMKMGNPLNNDGHNFVSGVSTAGKFLLLGNSYNADGTHAGDGVAISHKKEDGSWGIPENVSIAGFKNINDHVNFYLSNEENVLLMALEDDKSIGDLDMYVSVKDMKTGVWSKPENLGPKVNTHFREDYPHLSPDGKFLYFSSTGFIGFGGEDIYVSKRMGSGWTSWTEPLNLGPLVNTKADDIGFALSSSGNEAFFNSPNFENDTVMEFECYKVNLPKALRYEPQVEILGKIVSALDSTKKLKATLHLKKMDGFSEYISNSDPNTGFFSIKAPAGYPYMATVDNESYFTKKEMIITFESGTDYNMYRNFSLLPLPDSGSVYSLNNLSFYKGTPVLTSLSGIVLDSIARIYNQMPKNVMIEIAGHTDSKGDYNKNKKISLERAKEIACFLTEKGIAAERIQFRGYGPDKPIADNNTEAGRLTNRRIEITFLSKVRKDTDSQTKN